MKITDRLPIETAREYALRMLKTNISSTAIAPGSMLSEKDIAITLGLSRTPVREALIELSKEKLVEVLPQKGIRISLIDYDLVDESRFTRMVLECAILEYLYEHINTIDFSSIDENLKLQEFYSQEKNHGKILELDNLFHKELFVIANKLQTYQLMNSMVTHFDRVRELSFNVGISSQRVVEHKEILEALKSQNITLSIKLMKSHLAGYKVDKKEIYDSYPHYFK